MNAAKHAWVALLDEGDLLCVPPCWWHYVESGPGVNLMINAFVWALSPRRVRQFEVLMWKSMRTALGLSKEELASVRSQLYPQASGKKCGMTNLSKSGRVLLQKLSRFLGNDIPGYW